MAPHHYYHHRHLSAHRGNKTHGSQRPESSEPLPGTELASPAVWVADFTYHEGSFGECSLNFHRPPKSSHRNRADGADASLDAQPRPHWFVASPWHF